MNFGEFVFDEPANTIAECREKDLTYSRPLTVTVAFINHETGEIREQSVFMGDFPCCLLYTSDAADDLLCVDLGGRRILNKKNTSSILDYPSSITYLLSIILNSSIHSTR